MPALAPSHYAVRRLNLVTGRVAPIARLKLAAPRVMRGTGRMQVLAPDRSELYTLYTQQGPNYAHGAPSNHDPDSVHAFVHVLSLRDRWAHCIDLPAPFGKGHATSTALAVTPDGDTLFVTDWTQGAVASIDPSKLRVEKVSEIALGGADDTTFAAASDATLYVAGESTVVALDAATMSATARWDAPGEIEGLALAPDGRALYVAAGDKSVMLDPSLRNEVRAWRTPGVAGIFGTIQTREENRT
jgi:DNA-binding beta-propeller fold protein YncE